MRSKVGASEQSSTEDSIVCGEWWQCEEWRLVCPLNRHHSEQCYSVCSIGLVIR